MPRPTTGQSWRHPSSTSQATWVPSTRTSAKRSWTSLHAFQPVSFLFRSWLNGRFAEGQYPCGSLQCVFSWLCVETGDSLKEGAWDARVTGALNAERGEVFL